MIRKELSEVLPFACDLDYGWSDWDAFEKALRLCGGMEKPMVTGRMFTTGSWKLQERRMLISATEIGFFKRVIIQYICAGCCRSQYIDHLPL